MAENDNAMNVSQPSLPIFNGENYAFWSIKMKTLFRSEDLWDLVENGYTDPDEEHRLKENRKRDSKALFFIQQALHESVFWRIAAATTSKQAWTILQVQFQCSSKVIMVKLKTLRNEFEDSYMKSNESVQSYVSRMVGIVNQMRAYGDNDVTDQTVVAKILRSLSARFDHIVAVIEEAKDLAILSVDELSGSLQAHEARLNKRVETAEETALGMKGGTSNAREGDRSQARGRGRGISYRGRRTGRGRGRSMEHR